MSCSTMSFDQMANIPPVSPPTLIRKMNSKDQSLGGGVYLCTKNITFHLQYFISVLTAMIILAAMK